MLPTTNIPTLLETLRVKINETHWIEGVKEVVNGLINVVEKQNQELLALQSLLDRVLAENPELRSKKKSSEQGIMSPSEVLKELDRLHKDQQFETLRYDYPGSIIEDNENLHKFRVEVFHTKSRSSLQQFQLLYYLLPRPCERFTAPVEAGGGYSGRPESCVHCGNSYDKHMRLAKEPLAWSDRDFIAVVFDPLRIVAVGSTRVRTKEMAVAAGHLTPLILPGNKVAKTLAEGK